MQFYFTAANTQDFDRLFQLRLLTMRASLERIGRFDPKRAFERFQGSFRPEQTRLIMIEDTLAGCVALGPDTASDADVLQLEHFYIHPQFQGNGLGGAVLSALLEEVGEKHKTIKLSVLQQSDAARFYEKHGFIKIGEDEWDIYYSYVPNFSRESNVT